MRRVAAAFVVIVSAGLALTGSAGAAVDLSTSVEPVEISFPRQRVITYRLTMTTGEQAESLSVMPSQLPFAHGEPPVLEGPGTLGFGLHEDPGGYAPYCPRHRTPLVPGQSYTVDLPPRSTSALVTRFVLLAAPWPRTDLSVHYSFDSFSPNYLQPITFVGPELRSPQPLLTGLSGVRIRLATRPGASAELPAQVRLGRTVVVRGRVDPAVTGDRLTIRAGRWPDGRRAVTIARPRVDADGHYRVRWRPRHRRTYAVFATYRPQRPGVSSDATPCNVLVKVN